MNSRNEEFSNQIRQALENLHDFARLQALPLVTAMSNRGHTVEQSVRQLRAALLESIDQLDPTGDLPPRAKERRPYVILYGRYVQGLETADLLEELAISVRQLRREQKRALKTVTTLMEDRLGPVLATSLQEQRMTEANGRQEAATVEVDQLVNSTQREHLDLLPLVRQVCELLAPVARQYDVNLQAALPETGSPVRGQRVIMRQSLLGILSYAIHRAGGGFVRIASEQRGDVRLRVHSSGRVLNEPRTGISIDISRQLIASLDGTLTILDSESFWEAEIVLPTAETMPILIMDDNAGLVALFRRYLAGHSYSVVAVHTAEEALTAARDQALRLIILDIMMPEQDGWEVLEKLRAAPETAGVPVLICSVVNEPELAFALGASDYLTKPVTQAALLTKVERWCTVPPVPAAPPTTSPVGSSGSRLS